MKLRAGTPATTRGKLQLYDRYHAFQSISKGWPIHPAKDLESYRASFVDNLAASIYKQGEFANEAQDYRVAADYFLRMSVTSRRRARARHRGHSHA